MELREFLGKTYEDEKELTKNDGKMGVCEACGLAHITSYLTCPVCFYEWADGDDAEEIRDRYFKYMAQKDAELFRKLREKYQKDFGKDWKAKLQEENFLWLIDKMKEVYEKL